MAMLPQASLFLSLQVIMAIFAFKCGNDTYFVTIVLIAGIEAPDALASVMTYSSLGHFIILHSLVTRCFAQ